MRFTRSHLLLELKACRKWLAREQAKRDRADQDCRYAMLACQWINRKLYDLDVEEKSNEVEVTE
jgi:hypothetical protein